MSQAEHPRQTYFERWRRLPRSARLYLVHVALLTGSLAISNLLFNLFILALGYPRTFLALLHSLSVLVAALVSLPLWLLVSRIGLKRALLASAAFQAASALVIVIWPTPGPLLVASGGTGIAAVLFQVSAAPFMMRHSDAASRDHLFSANATINIGIAGLGSLIAGWLPVMLATIFGGGPESIFAYRATFAIVGAGLLLSLLPLALIREEGPASRPERAPTPVQIQRRGVLTWLRHGPPDSWRAMLRHPWPVVRLMIPPLVISCGAALLIPYLNLYFKQRFSVSDASLGLIFAGIGIASGLSMLGAPAFSLRLGKIKTVVLMQSLSLPFLLATGFASQPVLAVSAALARAALFNLGTPLYDAFAMERTAERARPLVSGLINGAYSAGYLFAPRISALVQERYGFQPLFLATAGFYMLAILLTYTLFCKDASDASERSPAHV